MIRMHQTLLEKLSPPPGLSPQGLLRKNAALAARVAELDSELQEWARATLPFCTAIGCHWLHSLGSRDLPSNLAAIAVMCSPNDSVARGCSGSGALQLSQAC